MSDILEKARAYEAEHEAAIPWEAKPAFHLAPRTGWMNDPNGISWYQGKYHLFYQYHPYDSHWGPMHWGHAVSSDLLHWENLPAALAPDMPYDCNGCFSGGAVALDDGRHLLMYTGVRLEEQPDGTRREVQTQCLAFGNGLEYEKYAHNPVLTEADLPEGGSRFDFRDPRVLRLEDGSFRALIANNDLQNGGQILLYRSDDGIRWQFVKVFAENHKRIGLMWECPDFFALDGWHVLLASAQDMLPKGFEYHNGNGSFYLLGNYDAATETFTELSDHAADYGIDFYAPQTILTPDGRRVMIGWLQNWDTCNLHTPSIPWFGQMSLPRELSVRNGVLCQQPLRELQLMRRDEQHFEDVAVENGEITLPGVEGRMLELEVEIEPGEGGYNRFAIRFAKGGEYHTNVSFRPHESVLKIDRKFSGSRRAIIHQRRAKVLHDQGRLKLRLILDRYSVEVFVGEGEQVLSAALSTELSAAGVSFFCDGKARIRLTKYRLEP